ncbi:MAG: hypothetical protein V4665_02765 [Patescibacteria group bacterium]
MNKEIIDFINRERIGVLAIEMPDGSPHAATLHFAVHENPPFFSSRHHVHIERAKHFSVKIKVVPLLSLELMRII